MFERGDIVRHNITLPIKIGKNIKYFTYTQFTIEETLNFNFDVKNKSLWLFDFLNKHGDKKLFGKYKLTKKEFMSIPFNKLYKIVVGGLMEGFYNFDEDTSYDGEEKSEYPLGAYLASISPSGPAELVKIMQICTPKQLKTYSEGMAWNINAQSDKGQEINKKILNLRKIVRLKANNIENDMDKLRDIHKKQVLTAKGIINDRQ